MIKWSSRAGGKTRSFQGVRQMHTPVEKQETGSLLQVYTNQLQVYYKWEQNNTLIKDYTEECLYDLKGGKDRKHLKTLIIKKKIIFSTLKLKTPVTQGSINRVQRQVMAWENIRRALNR